MTFRALITAEGIDDLHSVTLIDVLRRAGIEVVAASIEGRRMLTCARGTRLTADGMLVDVLAQTFDLIVPFGGLSVLNIWRRISRCNNCSRIRPAPDVCSPPSPKPRPSPCKPLAYCASDA